MGQEYFNPAPKPTSDYVINLVWAEKVIGDSPVLTATPIHTQAIIDHRSSSEQTFLVADDDLAPECVCSPWYTAA